MIHDWDELAWSMVRCFIIDVQVKNLNIGIIFWSTWCVLMTE